MPTLEPASPPVAEPGWYPDPVTDGRSERWWTGQAWAGYSRPRAELRPTPPASARTATSTALLSFLLGGIAVVLAIGSVLGDGHVWVTSVGVLAVVTGVRALVMRAHRSVPAQLLAVTGIAAGGLATLIMVALLLLPLSMPSGSAGVGDLGAAAGSGLSDVASPAPSATTTSGPSEVASPAPSATYTGLPAGTVLQVEPRQPLPDDALDSYADVTVRSVTSAGAGCGVVRAQPDAFPIGSPASTEARRMQDYAGLQLQAMRNALVYPASGAKLTSWPTSLDLDPETRVVFTAAPSCTALGVLPKGDELHFAISPDHGQIALAIWNGTYRTGDLWRSVDDTLYAL